MTWQPDPNTIHIAELLLFLIINSDDRTRRAVALLRAWSRR